ncbi:hypothetical protein HNP49_000481 [Pseudomonas fluvialis]|uniref:Solute-binding protein family 3/N-terminal domain-containing protein n=1 Tax=Pseudomonas fluvialis TaxID=1793966 RepID=A0A7X0BRR6_9PSED|nr:transporter substrate-binding domain-containing protein [Pseudomonas fluvialis]MBB6340331.1 hypothetical protein [Pseudomonas fluvialis]
MLKSCWLTLLLLCSCASQAAELRLCQHAPEKYAYRLELTELILARTAGTFGPQHIASPEQADPPQERCLHLLQERQVDLAFVPPTAERLRDFAVIPVDLHQGMLGYRLLLIRRDQAERFARVQTLEDLRQLRGGFGSQWSDFSVFAANGLPVVGMANPNNLLAMLSQGRFDYYHRGLHEAWSDLAHHPEYPNLMVEPHLALVYPMPVYFTFHRHAQALKQRFEEGLRLIQADGSLEALFQRHFGAIADRAGLTRRRLIPLDYPAPAGLPATTRPAWLKR